MFCLHIILGCVIRSKYLKLSAVSYLKKWKKHGKLLPIEKKKECVVKSRGRKNALCAPLINSHFINTI